MKIVQIVPNALYGDAVSNDILALDAVLKKNGFDAEIYASVIDDRIKERVKCFDMIGELNSEDILIYHMATASPMTEYVKNQNCKKVLRYHNITPPKFFYKYNQVAAEACYRGIQEVKGLKDCFDICVPDSEFNASDLRDYGYNGEIYPLPIMIPFEDYKKDIDVDIYDKYNDGKTNILFVGRFAPNKKWEDVISAFAMYQRYWNSSSRLIMVGKYDVHDPYYKALAEYVKLLKIRNAVFTGHIGFDGILACYKVANLFLCLSEHEGFCVPLIEAMIFKKPIIAYGACAVPETMGIGTMVIQDKKPAEVAGFINRVITDYELSEDLVRHQNDRLRDFRPETVEKQFIDIIRNLL